MASHLVALVLLYGSISRGRCIPAACSAVCQQLREHGWGGPLLLELVAGLTSPDPYFEELLLPTFGPWACLRSLLDLDSLELQSGNTVSCLRRPEAAISSAAGVCCHIKALCHSGSTTTRETSAHLAPKPRVRTADGPVVQNQPAQTKLLVCSTRDIHRFGPDISPFRPLPVFE